MKIRFAFLLLILCIAAVGQEYDVRISNIKDEQSRDVPATFAIVEDSIGFIWFGTYDGLIRFDGYRFKKFVSNPDDQNSLSNNTVRALIYDSTKHTLFIGTQWGGLNIFDINNQKFTRYQQNDTVQNTISSNNIWSLLKDKSGMLWIGMQDKKLNKFNPETEKFSRLKLQNKNPEQFTGSFTVRSLFQDVNENIWVGTDNFGLFKIDSLGSQSHYYQTYNFQGALKNNFVTSICDDLNGHVWISTLGAGVAKYNTATGTFSHVETRINENTGPISNITYAVLANHNNLWIGTEYGLTDMNLSNFESKHYEHQASVSAVLTDNRIRALFSDSKGILWIGVEAGVDMLVQQHNFKNFKNIPGNANSIPHGIVRAIFKDKNESLWVGLIDKGLVSYNHKSKKYTHYIDKKTLKGDVVCYQVTAILEDSNGILWIGDWEKGLLKFDKERKVYTQVLNALYGNNRLPDNRIQLIREESPGVLWIGSEGGIVRYNYLNDKLDILTHDSFDLNTIAGNSIQSQAFEIDKKGNLWVGTWGTGVNYIEINNRNPFEYQVNRFLNNKISKGSAISLYLQNDSILWVGLFGEGLAKYTLHSEQTVVYGLEQGLPNANIFSIIPGNNQELWLSTDKGISKFSIANEEFVNFTSDDGLQDKHFFWGAAHRAVDGEIFMGGISGLNSFYPDKVKVESGKYNLTISGIKVNNKNIELNQPVEVTKELNLKHNENYLTFDFALLDYRAPAKYNYRIMLKGIDDDWKNIGNQRSVIYSNLSPGNYSLLIESVSIQNNTVVDRQSLNINITNPWWFRWWSVSIVLVLFLGLLFGAYYLRIRVLLAQKRYLSEKIKERTKEIVEKSNLLVRRNEEIIMQKEELAEKNNQLSDALAKLSEIKEKAIESEKMASLGVLASGVAHEINNPLNYIQGGVFGIEQHFKNNDCGENQRNQTFLNSIKVGVARVAAIVSSLNQFSRGGESLNEDCNLNEIINNCLVILSNQLKNRISVNNEINPNSNHVIKGNQGKLHQAILNIITNAEQAIQEKGTITIEIEQQTQMLKLSISDNGKGMKKELLGRITEPFFTTKEPGEGTGLGLSLTYRIIKEHGGQLLFDSEVGKGTRVEIIFPIE